MPKHSKTTLDEYINNPVQCENQYIHLAPLEILESTVCESIQLLFDSEFKRHCVLSASSLVYVEDLMQAKKLYQKQISKLNNSLKSN